MAMEAEASAICDECSHFDAEANRCRVHNGARAFVKEDSRKYQSHRDSGESNPQSESLAS